MLVDDGVAPSAFHCSSFNSFVHGPAKLRPVLMFVRRILRSSNRGVWRFGKARLWSVQAHASCQLLHPPSLPSVGKRPATARCRTILLLVPKLSGSARSRVFGSLAGGCSVLFASRRGLAVVPTAAPLRPARKAFPPRFHAYRSDPLRSPPGQKRKAGSIITVLARP